MGLRNLGYIMVIYLEYFISDYSSSYNTELWENSNNVNFQPTSTASTNTSLSFDYSDKPFKNSIPQDMVSFGSTKVEDTTNPNENFKYSTSSYEHLPFKVIHPESFYEPIYTDEHHIQEEKHETKDAQNINNFKIINEPLNFEDFNVVDALMAEPIWSKIEQNVGGEDFNGAVSDIIPDHEMDHLSLSVPESRVMLNGEENSDFEPNYPEEPYKGSTSPIEESEMIGSRVSRYVNLKNILLATI